MHGQYGEVWGKGVKGGREEREEVGRQCEGVFLCFFKCFISEHIQDQSWSS